MTSTYLEHGIAFHLNKFFSLSLSTILYFTLTKASRLLTKFILTFIALGIIIFYSL